MKKLILLWSLFISSLLPASSSDLLKVLIVGAGPSGLSMAKALQNKGIYPDIIEKEDHIRSDGAGITISANGSWALDKLGINIDSKALLVQNMLFTDDQGEVLIQENITAIHPEKAQFYSLSRDELMKLLLSSLDNRIQIQTSTTLKDFSEENDQVKVVFSNGEIKFYDLVIGCDGVHSSLRRSAHPNEPPEFLGLLVWRTVLSAPVGVVMPTYMLGTDRAILLYPMPNDHTYVYGHIFQPKKNSICQSFSDVFAHFGGPASPALCAIYEQNMAGNNIHFYTHHMEKSHSVRFKLDGFSRILLVGDAAHCFGPMLQNGAAQAFEDAYVVQDLLLGPMKTTEIPALIDAFEKRRMARVQTVFTMSTTKIQALSNPEQIVGRNEAIRKFGAPNVNGFKLIMQDNP